VAVAASVSILPIKAWHNQKAELAKRSAELVALEQTNNALQAQVDRLKTPAGVVEAAREELGVVRPNEKVFHVVAIPPLPDTLPSGWLYPTIGALLVGRGVSAKSPGSPAGASGAATGALG